MVLSQYSAFRALASLGDDVPTFLDPSSTDLPLFTIPDAPTTTLPPITTAATPSTSSSWWDQITASAGQILQSSIQAGTKAAVQAINPQKAVVQPKKGLNVIGTSGTSSMLLYGALGLLAVGVALKMKKGRRA